MSVRFRGIGRIKDRYFLSSGRLLFPFLLTGILILLVRGKTEPPADTLATPEPTVRPTEPADETPTQHIARPEPQVRAADPNADAPRPHVAPPEINTEIPPPHVVTPEPVVTVETIPSAEVRKVTARQCFFEETFGTLAILPRAANRNSANRAGTFLVLPAHASCNVDVTHGPVWFQFNHHFSESDGQRRHLGALIIVSSRNAGSRRVEVYRNSGWTRPNRNEILGEFYDAPNLSWEQFVALNRESTSVRTDANRFDDAFGGPWHGIPAGGRKYSWDYQTFWNWAVSEYERTREQCQVNQPAIDRFRVSARLIAYTPTPRLVSEKPVVFYVNAASGDSIFVALYSLFNSGQDTRAWYWLHLE